MSESSNSYDAVPYLSGPIRLSHLSHQAAIAHLFGLQPAAPSRARILELGCASGGNIIPMACDYPDSEFVGIDSSARQIAEGNATIRQLDLSNVTLRCEDISSLREDEGLFDYVICHGVFSWVSPEVQNDILKIGSQLLAKSGIFYVSYNTFPGWHMRGIIRDMMQYHVANFSEPQEQVDQARLLLEFLVKSCSPDSDAYRILLRDEAKTLSQQHDSYLFHEHLEKHNYPLYFSEFAQRASECKLQYLGEAELAMMLTDNFPDATAQVLKQAPLLRQEQYMDFLRGRKFRCTLLCSEEIALNRNVSDERLDALSICLLESLPDVPVDLTADGEAEWKLDRGVVGVSSLATKLALVLLNDRFPYSMPVTELCQAVASKMETTLNEEALKADLLALLGTSLLRVSIEPPQFTLEPGETPEATRLARLQAENISGVCNRLHATARLDDVTRWLLPQLDGKRDRETLEKELIAAVREGILQVQNEQDELIELDGETAKRVIAHALDSLAKQALLVA